jgi:ATP adenylyltransferase
VDKRLGSAIAQTLLAPNAGLRKVFLMAHPPNPLWQKVLKTTERALESDALQPISTNLRPIPDQVMPFVIRVVENLKRKEAAQKTPPKTDDAKPFDPFLPYEEALFVDQLSEHYVCLLNKFNVVDHHLLMVTREYASQDSWLTDIDFEALVRCLAEINGLGFYNGGTDAGASQHQKHLQLIPLVSDSKSSDLPISSLIQDQKEILKTHHRLPNLPFWHSIYPLSIAWQSDHEAQLIDEVHRLYRQVMADLGLNLEAQTPNLPYNLLITRDWIMGVRRSQASYQSIGVNSLGYAGWLLVKTPEDLKLLQELGPINLLKRVSCPFPAQEGEESD